MKNERNQSNTGFAAYIGRKRIAWGGGLPEVIEKAKEILKRETTHKRFVPTVTLFDCAQIVNVGFITDDGNGITVHPAKHLTDFALT